MAKFIELTRNDGGKLLINTDHLVSVTGTTNRRALIEVSVTSGNDEDFQPDNWVVKESYDKVKRLLTEND